MQVHEWRIRSDEGNHKSIDVFRSVAFNHGAITEVHGPRGFAERVRAGARPVGPRALPWRISADRMVPPWSSVDVDREAVAFEFMPGVSLEQVLVRAPQFSFQAAITLAHDVQLALKAIYAVRSKFLDLNPATVRLGFRGGLMVLPTFVSGADDFHIDHTVSEASQPAWSEAVRESSCLQGLERLLTGRRTWKSGDDDTDPEGLPIVVIAELAGLKTARLDSPEYLRTLVDLDDGRVALNAHLNAAFPDARAEQLAFEADAERFADGSTR